MRDVDMCEYPERNRFISGGNESHIISEFLDHLDEQGIVLSKWVPGGYETWGALKLEVIDDNESIIKEFLEIDPVEL